MVFVLLESAGCRHLHIPVHGDLRLLESRPDVPKLWKGLLKTYLFSVSPESRPIIYIFPNKPVMFCVVHNETWMPCRTGNAGRIREVFERCSYLCPLVSPLPCKRFEVWVLSEVKMYDCERKTDLFEVIVAVGKRIWGYFISKYRVWINLSLW